VWGIWEMVSSTHEYKIKNTGIIEFVIEIPAGSKEKVVFEYRIDRRKEIIIKKE